VNSRMLATSGPTNQEVCSASERLAVDLGRNVVDGFNESLIPLTNRTSEVWCAVVELQFRDRSSDKRIYQQTRLQ
jgi:hypothetical protein